MTWFAECLIQRRHVDEAKHPDFAYDLSPAYKILKKVYKNLQKINNEIYKEITKKKMQG